MIWTVRVRQQPLTHWSMPTHATSLHLSAPLPSSPSLNRAPSVPVSLALPVLLLFLSPSLFPAFGDRMYFTPFFFRPYLLGFPHLSGVSVGQRPVGCSRPRLSRVFSQALSLSVLSLYISFNPPVHAGMYVWQGSSVKRENIAERGTKLSACVCQGDGHRSIDP